MHMHYFLALSAIGALAVNALVVTSQSNVTTIDAPSAKVPISLCSQYGYYRADDIYEFNNNLWGQNDGTGQQCTHYNGRSGPGVKFSSTWSWNGEPNKVKSFIYANRVFTRRTVGSIRSLPTQARWSYNKGDIRANVAYDIFTHPDPNHVNYNGEFELMIWLHRYGGIWPITDSPTGTPVTTVNIEGYNWDFYTGWNGNMRVYSFLPSNGPIYNFSADVLKFFNFLTQRYSYPANNQYMLIYQFGTEAFTGTNAVFDVQHFQADVNA